MTGARPVRGDQVEGTPHYGLDWPRHQYLDTSCVAEELDLYKTGTIDADAPILSYFYPTVESLARPEFALV